MEPLEVLQNSIVCHMRKGFYCLKLQMYKSIIDIPISYIFGYPNSIRKN